jgi:hypothetical protein
VKETPMFADDPSTPTSISVQQKIKSNIPNGLAELFIRLNRSSLLGSAPKEWQRVVENAPKLADSSYPKELARIVAVALVSKSRSFRCTISKSMPKDITKTNADYDQLQTHFEALKERFAE